MTRRPPNNKPIFKGLKPNSTTRSAYCPKCDAVIRSYRQVKCEKCGLELEWGKEYENDNNKT